MTQLFEKPKFQNLIQFFLNSHCDMDQQVKQLQPAVNNPIQLLSGQGPLQSNPAQKLILSANADKKQNPKDSGRSRAELLGEGNLNSSAMSLTQSGRKPALPAYLCRPIRVFILEMIPQILVSDGFNFIEAVFTKESIYEFRKNFSHCKFSSLKDKVIYLSKWSLYIDTADSKQVYNSYSNITVKLIVESFKPISHETVGHRHVNGVQSIFRDENIQTLIRSFRHWFKDSLINKNAVTVKDASTSAESVADACIELPSLKDIMSPKTNHSWKDPQPVDSDEKFGKAISNSNVFRIGSGPEDFLNMKDVKQDSLFDLNQFISEVQKRRDLQIKELRFFNVEQLIIQEQGEKFFKENKERKTHQYQEKVDDENHREALKLKIEYFQIGTNSDIGDMKRFENKWQREDRERMERGKVCRSQKVIVSYTFRHPLEQTKKKILSFLNCSKNVPNSASKAIAAANGSPIKGGRPRANSSENILAMNDNADQKSNLLDNHAMTGYPRPQCREPLSQFVCHQLQDINSDTQSEDSMDAEMNKQMQLEKENKNMVDGQMGNEDEQILEPEICQIEVTTSKMQPINISLYRQYLEWFQQNELMRIKPVSEVQSSQEKQGKESAKPLLSENTTKAESMIKQHVQGDSPKSPRFNNLDDVESENQKKPTVEKFLDQKMSDSIKDSVNESSDEQQAKEKVNNNIDPKDFQVIPNQDSQEETVQKHIESINMEITREELKHTLTVKDKQNTEPASEEQQSSQTFQDQQKVLSQNDDHHKNSLSEDDVEMIKHEDVAEEPEDSVKTESEHAEISQSKSPVKEPQSPPATIKTLKESSPEEMILEESIATGQPLIFDTAAVLKDDDPNKIDHQIKMMQLMMQKLESQKLVAEQKEFEKKREQERLLKEAKKKKEREERERIERVKREAAERKRQEEARLRKLKEEEERKKKEAEVQRLKEAEVKRLKEEQEERERQQKILEQQRLKKEQEEKELLERIEKQKIEAEKQLNALKLQEQRRQLQILSERKDRDQRAQIERQRVERERERERQKKLRRDKIVEQERMVLKHQEQSKEVEDQAAAQIKMMEQMLQNSEIKAVAPIVNQEKTEEQIQKKQENAMDDEDDWPEGDDDEMVPNQIVNEQKNEQEEESDDDYIEDKVIEEEEHRQDYVIDMTQKFGKHLDREIRKRESDDLNLRNFKSAENDDKLTDFMHIKQQKEQKEKFNKKLKNVKIGEKLVEQQNSGSKHRRSGGSPTKTNLEQFNLFNDQKYLQNEDNDFREPEQDEESYSEVEQDDQDQNQNQEQPDPQQIQQHENSNVILVSSETTNKDPDEIQEISAKEMKRQIKQSAQKVMSQQLPNTQAANVAGSTNTQPDMQNPVMDALKAQISQLTNLVINMQSQMNSQVTVQTKIDNKSSQEGSEDYHVPMFGSQSKKVKEVTPVPKEPVEPFKEKPVQQVREGGLSSRDDLKRTYSETKGGQEMEDGIPQKRNPDTGIPEGWGLQQWVEHQRMQNQKTDLKKQHEDRARSRSSSPMRGQQMRSHHSQGMNKQEIQQRAHHRQREGQNGHQGGRDPRQTQQLRQHQMQIHHQRKQQQIQNMGGNKRYTPQSLQPHQDAQMKHRPPPGQNNNLDQGDPATMKKRRVVQQQE